MSKDIKIMVVENQYFQYHLILQKLSEYDVYPKPADYPYLHNLIQVWASKRYLHIKKDNAKVLLRKFLTKERIDLFLIDYQLSGSYDGAKGTEFAEELLGIIPNTNVPIIFLSKTSFTTKEVIQTWENRPLWKWVEKGYSDMTLLQKEYFDLHVKRVIKELLSAAAGATLRDKLRALRDNSLFQPVHYRFNEFLRKIDTGEKLDQTVEAFVSELYNINQASVEPENLVDIYKKYGYE